ncbi:growth hormone secretagogue receptor type 1-like [Tubulanus polymorphus]|uniref:growth hormone secretagogue receptor type 1-like n=1 Tax=Tubulanus polymorphus TaxID=672921 RepID=UPI003DA4335E
MSLNRTSRMFITRTWQNGVWYAFNIYIYFWMVTGVAGSALSVIVLFRVRRAIDACSFQYLVPLAFSDSIFVVTFSMKSLERIHIVASNVQGKYMIFAISDVSCKLGMVLINFGIKTSSWVLLCFAIERSVAVLAPLQVGRLVTRARRRYLVLSIFVYFTITEGAMSGQFYVKTLHGHDGSITRNCQTYMLASILTKVKIVYSYAVTIIIPLSGFAVSTALIAGQFARRDARFKNTYTSEQERRCVRNLICIVVAYFLFNMPNTAFTILRGTSSVLSRLPVHMLHFYILSSGVLMITNSGVNFFIYVVNLKLFRDELTRLMFGIR